MCETCINRLFLSGPAPCPICKTTLRKSNFVVQTFEDLYVEKEVQIRKKVGRYFNKRPEDFPDLKSYNDYLEESEEMISNLINNVNVQETSERIERFRLENKDIIAANLAKQASEDKAISNQLAREKKEKQLRKEAYLNKQLEEKKSKLQQHQELINQIATTQKDVKSIIKQSKKQRVAEPAFKPIEKIEVKVEDDDMQIDNEPEIDDPDYNPWDVKPIPYDLPIAQTYTCPWTAPLLMENGEVIKAGGYTPSITFARALRAATFDLFHGIQT